MSEHEFRNPDKFQVLPFREWMRKNMPSGPAGFVPEDLDLVVRVYGKRYGTDADGKFILSELKYGNAWIDTAQKMTFGLMHRLLREADPGRQRYLGYYVINYNNEDWDVAGFKVNKLPLSKKEMVDFLLLRRFMLDRIDTHMIVFDTV